MALNIGGVSGIVESLCSADSVQAKNQQNKNTQFQTYLQQALLNNYMGLSSGYPYYSSSMGYPGIGSLTGSYYGQSISPYGLWGSSWLSGTDSSLWAQKVAELLEQKISENKSENLQTDKKQLAQAEAEEPAEGIKMRVINRYKQQISSEIPQKQGVLV